MRISTALHERLDGMGWSIAGRTSRPSREARYQPVQALPVGAAAKRFLHRFEEGIYRHQARAIERFSAGENVCLTTPTSSGKSEPQYAVGIDLLSQDPQARVMAVYPLKALAAEQQRRWQQAVLDAGLKVQVGRVDGGVPVKDREGVVRNSRVLCVTPDIVHAWFLANLARPDVAACVRHLSLVVLDEAHTYTGVFGTNSAYLLRRLNHVCSVLSGTAPRYMASSATMEDASGHMHALTGLPFSLVTEAEDTSPAHECEVVLLEPPAGKDALDACAQFMELLAVSTEGPFLAFADSRKQVEHLATSLRRALPSTAATDGQASLEGEGDEISAVLAGLPVCPYRSGYENTDRQVIQKRLRDGTLRGVVSTSALEMGIDLPNVSVGVLVGLPASGSSLYQRLGRIGRHTKGTVYIIKDQTPRTAQVFACPDSLWSLPLTQGALYMDNPYAQYVHATCLARPGGEHAAAMAATGRQANHFEGSGFIEGDFLQLCVSLSVGETPRRYELLAMQLGDEPNRIFPLRDMGAQYKVECIGIRRRETLGSLSAAQVMREAYPGAIYYYATEAYRVVSVSPTNTTVRVRREKRHTTQPVTLPPLIFPNLKPESILTEVRLGGLRLLECEMKVTRCVRGYVERRGRQRIQREYPVRPFLSHRDTYAQSVLTSGVVVRHPAMAGERVKSSILADLLRAAFLEVLPFSAQEVACGAGRTRIARAGMQEGDAFVCLYDNTCGSLRLTGRMMTEAICRAVGKAFERRVMQVESDMGEVTLAAAVGILSALTEEKFTPVSILGEQTEKDRVEVLAPGSVGVNIDTAEEFHITEVFYSPRNGLCYRGQTKAQKGTTCNGDKQVERIEPVPGAYRLAWFDLNTCRVVEAVHV